MNKKTTAPVTTITRDVNQLREKTGNLYMSVAIIAKRADQIQRSLKEEIAAKLEEFASFTDSLEEITENREQIEFSRYYERMPKPAALATQEFIEDKLIFQEPTEEGTGEPSLN
ncbi:MAG: DNA-directed RNA polymerase subunit omega [Flavobacteriales bacterium]|nr:DNA-directed RNA polymerase subunit omega [Flavobacteriales bacterium]MCX7767515.1 DNA-directed RNA polymerase subunit omega [Flavobacteriales bacterium]MDW8409650.1 hypothetical protein [Flavobacteriales bacterium]